MSNVAATENTNLGVINQLHSMLTNHTDRPKHTLNVYLHRRKDDEKIGESTFVIYANEPVSKITEKVEKMRTKGGISTIKISELKKINDSEYDLILGI